eukprot:1104718-Amphidinium_carterae.1
MSLRVLVCRAMTLSSEYVSEDVGAVFVRAATKFVMRCLGLCAWASILTMLAMANVDLAGGWQVTFRRDGCKPINVNLQGYCIVGDLCRMVARRD